MLKKDVAESKKEQEKNKANINKNKTELTKTKAQLKTAKNTIQLLFKERNENQKLLSWLKENKRKISNSIGGAPQKKRKIVILGPPKPVNKRKTDK